MTDIFFDLDFIENNRRLDLVSIGLFAEENGQAVEFYGINKDVNLAHIQNHCVWSYNCHPNVIEQTPHYRSFERDSDRHMHSGEIQRGIEEFLSGFNDPVLWSYFSCFNEVVLKTLYFGGPPSFEDRDKYPYEIKSIYDLILRYGLNAEKYQRNFPIYSGILETNLNNAKWNAIAYAHVKELVLAQTMLTRAIPVAESESSEVENDLSSLQETSQA